MNPHGVLLLNLGTPDDCSTTSVRRYLKEFLSDPRVIDIPTPLRWLLLNAVILPFRPKKTAAAYAQIWTEQGSPLLKNSQDLTTAVAKLLGERYQVALGMRYGRPSIEKALSQLKHCSHLTILPLFPQYSSAATGSALEKTLQTISNYWNLPSLRVIRDYYNHPSFIHAYAQRIRQHLLAHPVDIIIFSYHGLPERHIDKSQCRASCDWESACPVMSEDNAFCYRAQCYATSQALAQALTLNPEQYRVAFQSRLGRTPWIKPYTDEMLPALFQAGVRNIAIACPSFVADCLETLEEIGLRAKAQWVALGGHELTAVPCLNAEAEWVEAVVQLVQEL